MSQNESLSKLDQTTEEKRDSILPFNSGEELGLTTGTRYTVLYPTLLRHRTLDNTMRSCPQADSISPA
jgi:hypothetical protein